MNTERKNIYSSSIYVVSTARSLYYHSKGRDGVYGTETLLNDGHITYLVL